MPARAASVWLLLVALLAALSSSTGPAMAGGQAALLGATVAFVVGIGARSSLVLAALRAGRIAVSDDGGGAMAPLLTGVVGTVLATSLVAGIASAGVLRAAGVVLVAGVVGVVVALAWPRGGALRGSSSSLPSFLGRGAALAAVMAAALGAVVAVGRTNTES